jgi:putative protein-disulfide isomerase
MAIRSKTHLFYVHDPMCSWCWGFRRTFAALREQLPGDVAVRRLLGGLAADDDAPMPAEMQRYLQATWGEIGRRIPGTRFNFDFWRLCQPKRSTWPACRAVIAARQLAPGSEEAMIFAIQQAYYLQARNPADQDTLIALADELGIDTTRFAAALDAAATRETLAAEMARAAAMNATSFPSLRLMVAERVHPVTVDYLDPAPMLGAIDDLLRSG